MKAIKFLLTGLVGFASLLQAVVPGDMADDEIVLEIPEGNFPLEEAYRIAVENNPQMEEVAQRIEQANLQLKKAHTFLYPNLSLSGGYQAIDVTKVLEWMPEVRTSEYINQFDSGVSLSWMIFDGMRSIHYLRAAKCQVQSAEQQRLDAQRILLKNISGAFLQSQIALERMRIAMSDCIFNQRLLSDSKVRYDLGDVPEADMLNFSLGLAQAKANFKRAQQDYLIACSTIAQLLGYEDAQLPANYSPVMKVEGTQWEAVDFEQSFALAKKLRPDLHAVQIGLEAYEHQRKGVRSSGRPVLTFVAGSRYNKRYGSGYQDPDGHDSNVGVVLNWDIFDGNRRSYDELGVASQRNQLKAQYQLLLNNVAAQLRKIITDIETIQYVLVLQEQSVNEAFTIREHVENAYRAGSTSITRLNEAQNAYVKVSGALASLRLQQKYNHIQLNAETGNILDLISR